ncbi:MAG: histidinol-phosphatase HisJ, partial [Clostridium perfringens]|nr:histidinol-phosphatase HisJ [Clostridium perfringens]
YLIDYSKEEFQNLIDILGGIDNVYTKYYETVKKAIECDLGSFKPKRIGHLNLIRKYCKAFPYDYSKNQELESLVQAIKDNNYELDYNVSGKRKEDCGEVYIDGYLLDLVEKQNINMVLGSDSHSCKEIFCLKEFI